MLYLERKCNCLEHLIKEGRVESYCPPYNVLAASVDDVEEGYLCISNDIAINEGYYDGFEWKDNVTIFKELYPIDYCPICGKKIEYKKVHYLTKKN